MRGALRRPRTHCQIARGAPRKRQRLLSYGMVDVPRCAQLCSSSGEGDPSEGSLACPGVSSYPMLNSPLTFKCRADTLTNVAMV